MAAPDGVDGVVLASPLMRSERDIIKAARDLILGMKELPEKEGYWGLLLNKKGVPADLEPASASAFQSVNDRYILFTPSLQASNRGFGFVFGSAIGFAFLSMLGSILILNGLYDDSGFVIERLYALLIIALLGSGFFGWAYFFASQYGGAARRTE